MTTDWSAQRFKVKDGKVQLHGKFGESSCGVEEELEDKEIFQPTPYPCIAFDTTDRAKDVNVSSESIVELCISGKSICEYLKLKSKGSKRTC